MIDDFIAIVLFDKPLVPDAADLAVAMRSLEPGVGVEVRPGLKAATFSICSRGVNAAMSVFSGRMPEEASVSSLGMADIDEQERQRLASHGAHIVIRCAPGGTAPPIEKCILLLKAGMALCARGGWAVCIPASGLCLTGALLDDLIDTNNQGPRAWAVDEAEAALGSYEAHTLWDSLRLEAQPSNLLVGFVPAEVDGSTWFFSGGHSLFGLPELVFSDASIEDFAIVREYFRFLFPYLYNQSQKVTAGQSIPIDEIVSFVLEDLPEKHAELQSTTGTLRVRLVETPQGDADWD